MPSAMEAALVQICVEGELAWTPVGGMVLDLNTMLLHLVSIILAPGAKGLRH